MLVIKAYRESILKPLTTVSGAIDTKQTGQNQILGNVLIRTSGKDISFTGTDREILIRTHSLNDEEMEDTAFTVSIKKTIDLLKALYDPNVSISLSGPRKNIGFDELSESRRMEIKSGNSRFSLQTLPADQFPDFPSSDFTNRTVIPSEKLKHLITMVHHSMAYQDVRFYLNGLRLVISGSRIRAVTTDGRRLSVCDETIEGPADSGTIEATIPRKTVIELRRLLPDSDTPVTIEISKSQARFTFDEIELSTKVIEGKYPDYERVIPKNNDKKFTINRESLLRALHRTAVLSSDKLTGVRWLVSTGVLSLQTINSDQEEGTDEINMDYSGEQIDIGFNFTYLIDILSTIKTENVVIALSNPQASALITMPDNDSFKYVIMPMRL